MTRLLTVNAGSSSVRLAQFRLTTAGPQRLEQARLDRHEPDTGVSQLAAFLHDARPAVVAHRVVHAGPDRRRTCAFDGAVKADLERFASLAPLHNPATVTWFERCRSLLPGATHLAVFDAGFFAGLPEVATTYALPAALTARHQLRRLGFHGLAHRSMWQTFTRHRPAARRVITFQLGSGCSAAALRDGAPVDTSMGFSPLEGLVMNTRAGDLDPGLLLYLMQSAGLTADGLADLLSRDAGLLGVSGLRGGIGALIEREREDPAARLAVELFVYRARKYLGAYLVALGGCDAVLFGGGAAEHTPALCARIIAGLEAVGLAAGPTTRDPPLQRLTADGSTMTAWIVPTDEEAVMADEATQWLADEATQWLADDRLEDEATQWPGKERP